MPTMYPALHTDGCDLDKKTAKVSDFDLRTTIITLKKNAKNIACLLFEAAPWFYYF